MDRGLDTLAILSVLLGLENLQENREQSAQQEKILQEIMEIQAHPFCHLTRRERRVIM